MVLPDNNEGAGQGCSLCRWGYHIFYIDSTRVGINNGDMVIGGSSNGVDWFKGVIDDIIIAKGCDELICRFSEPHDSDNSGFYDFLEAGGPVSYDLFLIQRQLQS